MSDKFVENYYQGIYLTETIMGNPNGDFVDNTPRNIDGKVFTTDKCIKYNVRKFIHDTIENIDEKENIVFFFPRLTDESNIEDNKFETRDGVFDKLFDSNFEVLKNSSPDVRMFGGTFSFTEGDSKQIYGPIQISYGLDINDAQIKRLQIGAPFSTEKGKQTTNGSESVVDDAIISYDIVINPNNYPGLLLNEDLSLFKRAMWFGTNLRKTTSKKTESKLLILIKFNNDSDNEYSTSINMGGLNKLISISNKDERKKGVNTIKIDCTNLKNKLDNYKNFIDSVELIFDPNEVELENFVEDITINKIKPQDLL